MDERSVARRERLAGGLIGLLVGDALGVPYEFHDPKKLPPEEALEMEPPAGFRRAHLGVPPGTWSDDGAQALCLLASLLERQRLDLDDLGERLYRWSTAGYMAVDGLVFDIGIQTSRAMAALERGAPAAAAGPAGEHDNGNGALMRVAPLALWHRGGDAALVADAHAQCLVTHGHPRAQVCAALYCLWVRRFLQEAPDPWEDAVSSLRRLYGQDAHRAELERHVLVGPAPRGSGYVVDCLRSAHAALGAGPYEAAVRAAVAYGLDTDTTACVAGGAAGARDGLGAIPARWREALRGQELLAPLLDGLVAWAG